MMLNKYTVCSNKFHGEIAPRCGRKLRLCPVTFDCLDRGSYFLCCKGFGDEIVGTQIQSNVYIAL